MSRITVNEGSTSYHAISFTDQSGAPVVPEAIRYKVSDSAEVLVNWTALDVSATEIEIDATVNVISGNSRKRFIGDNGQNRFLTIEATHNGGDKITSEIEYSIVDLKGV